MKVQHWLPRQIAFDLVEELALRCYVSSALAAKALNVDRRIVWGIFEQHHTDIIVQIQCVSMFAVDGFQEFILAQVHQLGEPSRPRGKSPWLTREKSDFSEDVAHIEVFDVGPWVFLQQYYVSLNNEEKPLADSVFLFVSISNELALLELPVFVKGILLLSFIEHKIIH